MIMSVAGSKEAGVMQERGSHFIPSGLGHDFVSSQNIVTYPESTNIHQEDSKVQKIVNRCHCIRGSGDQVKMAGWNAMQV